MPCAPSARVRQALFPWLAAALCAGLVGGFELDWGFDLSDEGFLWHGVARTAAGELPERDFQAGYEPGRFYLGALFEKLFGPGLATLRIATASVGALGLGLGLCAARRSFPQPAALAALASLLALWMGPRHKLFEPATAFGVALALARLVERPDRSRLAQAGAAVGLALCVGRNHALYAAAALLVCLARRAHAERRLPSGGELLACAAGGALGASPLAALALAAPGYATAFAENLRFYALHGPNHPLPIPWPWRPGALAELPGTSLGMLGEALLPLALVASLWRARPNTPAHASAFASAAVALAYSHHALARADTAHLSQAIPPLLLALAQWPAATERRALGAHALAALAGFTALALPEIRPLSLARAFAAPGASAALDVGGRAISVPTAQALELAALARAVDAAVPPGAALFAAPAIPGIHPWLGRRALAWRSYFLWPAAPDEERRIVDALVQGESAFALIDDRSPFGSDSLRFSRSHPRVDDALAQHFAPVAAGPLPPGYRLLARRSER
jgi:hypothetical protein